MFKLKNALIGFVFAAFAAACLAADLQPTIVDDFSGGLVDKYDASLLPSKNGIDMLNVDVWSGKLTKRRGSVAQNTSSDTCYFSGAPKRFLHEYVDTSGTFILLSVASNS